LFLFVNEWFVVQADVGSAGSSAQVNLSDVETLKQQSPTAASSLKRSASIGDLKDTEAEYAVSIAGHKRARH
jgi:hypothetical protein